MDERKEDIFSERTNLMEYLPTILNVDKDNFKMTPSEFIKEMSMTLEERHKKLIHLSFKVKPAFCHYPTQFRVTPCMLVFQRFEILATNYLSLEVMNIGKFPIGIKMQCPDSIYFSASFAGKPLTKLAPGLSVEYKIAFTPQEAQDYRHYLLFTSTDFTFKVPIVAIGPRPMLDIPDQIFLNPSPVKIATSKFIVVRNIGDAPAVFSFSTGSKYFQVSPAKGILAVHDSMLLNITFESSKVRQVTETLYLMFETGEKFTITLHGSAENISIRLDKNSVVHEDTFIGLKRCKTVRVINNGSNIVKFSWKKNKTVDEDLNIIKSMKEKYEEMTELEVLKDARVTHFGLSNHESHKLSCERILKDELKLLEKEEFKFSDDVFTLIPQSGEVWPKDSKEIMITFGPKTCGPAQAEAFLEVSGRDSRLPLKIRGNGLGPDIAINIKVLDIDYIYLCSHHKYEIVIQNRGDIPGTVEYISEPLVFGGRLEIIPQFRCLKPDEVGLFIISFTSNRPGDFTEKLNFNVKESGKKLSLTMKGKIVSPTLHFDNKEINFGAVPFGISITREATLNNLSVVPVTFSLRVSPDGVDHSVCYDEFARFTTKPSIPQYPKEFEVNPEESVVEPYSSKKVTVTVTANKVGSFRKQLIVDMWDSENGSVSCPIHYRVEVANLVGDPDMIIIPFCFINYPYTRSITLKNLSHVAGLFYIVPLNPSTERPVTYSANVLQGVIPPHRSIKIEVTIIISSVGRQVFPISMLTFGSDLPQEICTISCLGQGPIINVEPSSLVWGQVPLLTSSKKTLNITNVSPIPASLELSLGKPGGNWNVTPGHVKISPEQIVTVTVLLFLNECGKFKDFLKINIYNGKDFLIPLSAVGVGSSLLMTPNISPVFDLETLFCHKKYEFQISLENKGTKSYGLLWSPYVEYKTFVNAKFSLPEDSVFRMEPIKMDLMPGETKTMTVEAFSKTTGIFTQTFYCFANTGSPTKKLHYTSEIRAKFVGPTITFDKEEINFWYYTGPDGIEEKLLDSVFLKNTSVLPVYIHVSTNQPFCLLSENSSCLTSLRVTLEGLGKFQLKVKFLAPQNIKKYFKVYTGKLVVAMNDSSKTSSVALKGEVSYPNISIKPGKVDFGHVKVGANACIEVHLLNTSPLTVYYDIKWKKQMCQVTNIEKQTSTTICTDRVKESETEDAQTAEEAQKLETLMPDTPVSPKVSPNVTVPEKPVLKMPDIDISNSDVKAVLYTLTRPYYDSDNELLDAYKMARPPQEEDGSSYIVETCNKYCSITPFFGKLEPFCSQILYVGFCSDTPVKVHLEALIQIRAGPTEVLTIDAISGDIDYRLSATELDFGKQLFCETQSQVLKIRNTSDMPFTFETYTGKEECDQSEHFSLGQGVVTISPSSGTLNSFQTVELVVRYHPGVPGKFETVFRLRIGHMNPVFIKVRGVGVFPQVYVFLPRPEILKISPEIGYLAVASITPDWILTDFPSGTCIYDLNQLKPYRSRENSLCQFAETDGESWEIIKSQECIPSEIDIFLAVERILAYELISEDRNNTSFAVYARTIPQFVVPGYELDFGVCVIGRAVEKQVMIMNLGPLPVIFYGIFGMNLKEEGIHVRLKNRNELKVGSCLPFIVAFNPKRTKYKKKYELIKSIFYFEIYHGPKIPIRISAEVTYPQVQPSLHIINFREVICGQCKIINLRLKNSGLVRARWTLVLKNEMIHTGSMTEPSTLRPMFSVDSNSGVLNPSEYCTVQVSFKPLHGKSFSAILLVQVAKSPENLKIRLLGVGFEPKLLINKSNLTFSSALPFPNNEEESFFVENPSSFTIEYCFPEFDEQVFEEDNIIQALATYYQTDEILLPLRRPGEGLPPEVIDFYHSLLEGLNSKFMEKEREKLMQQRDIVEDTMTLHSMEGEVSQGSSRERPDSSVKKKSRKILKPGTNGEVLGANTDAKDFKVRTIFESKTPEEIQEMLQDYIKNNMIHEKRYDPVQAAIKSNLPPVVQDEQKQGTLIICHGAPYTNSVLLANRLAISISRIALSIDQIVQMEAALARCEAGAAAKELIEEAYWEYVEVEKKERTPFEEWGESEAPSEELSFDSSLEEIQRKFKALVELKYGRESISRGRNGVPGTAKSETSRKMEKSSSPGRPQTNVNIPSTILSEDVVFDILKFRLDLEVGTGVVIEGLESVVIPSPTRALALLLKAVGNIRDIIAIFFLSNYKNFIQNLTTRHSEQELAKSYLREEILNVLEEEPEEAFKSLNLPEEEEEIFRKYFLQKRHEGYDRFRMRREKFYDLKRLKIGSPKQEDQVPSLHLNSNSQRNSRSEKKGKDSGKKKGTSKASEMTSRKEENDGKLGRLKRDTIEGEFLAFEMDLIEMRAVMDNWDQRIGAVVSDSTEIRSRKGQTPRKVESSTLDKADDSKKGIFIWLVDVSRPNSNSFVACCNYLNEVLKSRRQSESDTWPQDSGDGMTYSVVSPYTKQARLSPQGVFILSPLYPSEMEGEDFDLGDFLRPLSSRQQLSRTPSALSFKSKRKGISRRGRTDPRMTYEAKGPRKISTPTAATGEEVPVDRPMKSRWILEPGEKQNFRVRYFPTQLGTWEHKYFIRMINWPTNEFITCFGVCDIPRINMKPEVMFPAVEQYLPLTSRFHPAYYYSLRAFDFGAIIAVQPSEGKKIGEKTVNLTLHNESTLPVDMTILLDENEQSEEPNGPENMTFYPNKLRLEPGEKKVVTVTACPTKYGPVTRALLFVIKNNPMVERVKFLFQGVKANVSVSPKNVIFERQLLQRKQFRNMVFTNDNTIELYAVLVFPEDFPPQFTFSHTSLWLSPTGSFTAEISYSSAEVQIVHEKPVQIQIFDSPGGAEPVQELTFFLSAESYDAALDITFSKPEEDHIDFGDIRVENYYTIEFYLKNVGKYQLGYKIDIDNEAFSGAEYDQFQVTPQFGKLQPGKIFPVSVTAMVQNEISWKRVPVLKITLVEPFYGDEVIAVIPISVSLRSHFARYEIKPLKHLSFGHIQVCSSTSGSILIENKGLFSLSYFVDLLASNQYEDTIDSSKKSSKISTDRVDRSKKNVASVFKAGIFEISPGAGKVEPGQTAVLKVNSNPREVKVHEEDVVIYVDESLPHLKNGNPLKISAEACLPKIRFQEAKSVFREHYMCKDEEEFNPRIKPGSYMVFYENNSLFSFKNICVNTTAEARIHLENAGLVDCSVTAVVKPPQEEEGIRKSQPEGAYQRFSISPEKLIVEPYNTGILVLSFRPEALEVYRAQVVLTINMPEGFPDEVWAFKVWGNGIFPQIEITEPNVKLPEGPTLVNFPPTSPGHITTTSIAFTNTGYLDCKVIMELCKFQTGVFSLLPKPGTEKMLKIWDLKKPIDHTAVVSLSPGEVAEFCLFFKPLEVRSHSSEIKLFIVDNPFENWMYKLVGEVFLEEVVIERIRKTLPFFSHESPNDRSAIPIAPGQYFINLSDCYVNKKSKVLMRLSNKTEADYFRFEWEEFQSISISPNVGHLYPKSYKEILLVFYPEEPVELEDVAITCTLNKILLDTPTEPSWDSRLSQCAGFQNKSLKPEMSFSARSTDKMSTTHNLEISKAVSDEPAHELVPESTRYLYLNISGIADYTRLICQTDKIFFKSTFMFQNRVFPLVLENTGNVALEYKLNLKAVTVWPLMESKKSQVDEQSLLKLLSSKNRPKSSDTLRQAESCRAPRATSPCHVSRCRPYSSFSKPQEDTLDDCDQEPVQSCSKEDRPYFNPFRMENAEGRILAKEKASCNLIFSPMDMNQYKAIITIQVPYLHPECHLPEIEVSASSMMPYCHFDVPESDYLVSGRRDHSQPGPVGYAPGVPLHPSTKTIEVKVIGIGATVPIKFHVINPTEEDYSFSWLNTTQVQPGVVPSFHCSTLGGRIRAGRQQLMVFSFKSHKVGISESFWKFSIPEFGIETPFLLVGDARAPSVYFLSYHVTLKPTLIGTSASDVLTLVNDEESEFEFHFLRESLFSEARLNSLKVDPTQGKIPPKSETAIRVSFTGRAAGKAVFNIKCKVRTIKEPFVISVEAHTYLVQPVLAFEDLNKVKHFPDSSKENFIDFGSELHPNVPETITINFTNLARTSFNYEWEYDTRMLDTRHCKLLFSPTSGHVASKGKCELMIVFSKKSSLVNFPAKLKVHRGPTFEFLVSGSASTTVCEFSFSHYDFGYAFVQENNNCYNEAILVIRNKNDAEVFLECALPDGTPFSYTLSETIIPPRGEIKVRFSFKPKECIPYSSIFKVTINGLYERCIQLKGHGTDFKVVLADAEDLTISLGAIRVGKSSTREFSLINESLAVATLLVGFCDQLPVDDVHFLKLENHHVDLSQGHRLTGVLTISPSTFIKMKPQEKFTLSVTYTPKERSPPFSETVCLQYHDKTEPLCVLTGYCLAADISLDRRALNFGAVVKSCNSKLRLKLVNSGSIGASFVWNVADLNVYKLSPVQGYCSPESDVTIEVSFSPVDIQSCIKKMVECKLYLPDNERYPSLWLELIGDCVALPDPKEVLIFECNVRQTTSKELLIENPSGREWQLVPVVSGEYFKGYDALIVPPLTSVKYEVKYCPLMLSDGQLHKGSVFFKLPTGQALLYELRGTSTPPPPEDSIKREVPSKTKYVELLKVKNWLQCPQRFKVKISSVEIQDDPTFSCTGFEYLDVPGMGQKEYSLNFFSYNIGTFPFNVYFQNEETNEFIWYNVTFKVHACGPLEMITLKTAVRQVCKYELKLENPLSKPVKYDLKATSPEVKLDSTSCEVPPTGSAHVTISFTPIHPGEKIEGLTATCPELGVFPRELRLVGMEILPEPARTFETTLGNSNTQEIPVKNFSPQNAVFSCKIDSEDFKVQDHATATAGTTYNFKVTYEPSEIGSTTATLTIHSNQAGNFSFPLLGFCDKPLAKGPFILKQTTGANIPFKNIFKTSKEFHISVDNRAFTLKSTKETLSSKEEIKINVGLQKLNLLTSLPGYDEVAANPKFPIAGQLIVECYSPYVKWQFYLKGVLDK